MKAIINIKADVDTKREAVRVAQDMGVPLSTIINAFLKKFISDRSVTLFAPSKPNKKLQKILNQSSQDSAKGKNLSPMFTNMDDMDRYLGNI